MAAKPIKIGLLWHSANSSNLGVAALTIANMAILHKVASELDLAPSFSIIGMGDGRTSYLGRSEAEVYNVTTRWLLDPAGCSAALGRQDCIIDIGAGDSFAEIYGLKRFGFLWFTKILASTQKKPLLLAPQTIGPFTRTPYRQLARMALNHAKAVVVRDPLSLDALHELAPSSRGILSTDVAFALPYNDQSAKRGGTRIRVGVNVSGLLFTEAQSGTNRYGLEVDYADLMRRFLAGLAARPEIETHLIVHVNSPGPGRDDDRHVADQLAQEFPTAVLSPSFSGPSEAKSYISGLDFLVAGRMHACIAAFGAGTPVVPVAYSRKFSGLFGLLDYPWRVPVKGLNTDQAFEYLNACLERRDELARDIACGMGKVTTLLDAYRSELRRFLTNSVLVQ